MVALFVSRVGSGWEMHTQQGKGKRDSRQFSKNNTAQVSCVCPRAHPAEGQTDQTRLLEPAGRPVPARKTADICDFGAP